MVLDPLHQIYAIKSPLRVAYYGKNKLVEESQGSIKFRFRILYEGMGQNSIYI